MSHNTLPPSKYGAGTTYEGGDGSIKHIVPPVDHGVETYKIPVNMPRIARESGTIAVSNVVTEPSPGSYQSSGERLRALEYAEVQNKIRAAEAAGMTVDQWNANGRPMKGSYSGK